jgi:ActR/RegA family two-component response regulator
MRMNRQAEETSAGLSLYLRNRIMDEDGALQRNLPSLEDLKREYVRFLLEVTNHDLTEVANILNISRAVDSRELREHIISSFN